MRCDAFVVCGLWRCVQVLSQITHEITPTTPRARPPRRAGPQRATSRVTERTRFRRAAARYTFARFSALGLAVTERDAAPASYSLHFASRSLSRPSVGVAPRVPRCQDTLQNALARSQSPTRRVATLDPQSHTDNPVPEPDFQCPCPQTGYLVGCAQCLKVSGATGPRTAPPVAPGPVALCIGQCRCVLFCSWVAWPTRGWSRW